MRVIQIGDTTYEAWECTKHNLLIAPAEEGAITAHLSRYHTDGDEPHSYCVACKKFLPKNKFPQHGFVSIDPEYHPEYTKLRCIRCIRRLDGNRRTPKKVVRSKVNINVTAKQPQPYKNRGKK